MSAFEGKADIEAKLLTKNEVRRIAANAISAWARLINANNWLNERLPALALFAIDYYRRETVGCSSRGAPWHGLGKPCRR